MHAWGNTKWVINQSETTPDQGVINTCGEQQPVEQSLLCINRMTAESQTGAYALCGNELLSLAYLFIYMYFFSQIQDLYEDFHVIRLPLLAQEVRGKQKIEEFSKHLITPYAK